MYLTNSYNRYSNSLSVVVTGITTSASASWQVVPGSDNEYTNSSTYSTYGTNFTSTSPLYSNLLSTIPTGTYSLSFSSVRGHKSPAATNVIITGAPYAWSTTNVYQPYTNGLNVAIAGVSGTNVVWTLSPPAEYTNCTFTNLNFTNTYPITPIPTGAYVVTFPSLSGYTTPGAVTSVIASGTNTVTGTYSAINGYLSITMAPPAVVSSAPWTMTAYPAGYTNGIFNGTGAQTISNVIIGQYTITFGDVANYTKPSAQSGTVYSNQLTIISGTYTFQGYNLTVYIGAPWTRQTLIALPGIGSGPCRIDYGSGITTQTVADATYAVNNGQLVTLTALTNYVYKWYRNATNASLTQTMVPLDTSYSFTMREPTEIWLLYSTAYNNYDNAGDIDHDQLPDTWELTWFGDNLTLATDKTTPNKAETVNTHDNADNPDGDWIPSASTNAPTLISINTNNIITYYAADGTLNTGYPLQNSALLRHQSTELPQGNELGYAKGAAFDNLLECRGLDVYYLTNGPTGWVASDDPLTDPEEFDTFSDPDTLVSISDGWKYYFWYWRSAEALNAGLSNSAGWVTWTRASKISDSLDSDGDNYIDVEEYTTTWTDPTHCDTDGDGMDDYWEAQFDPAAVKTNALDYANNWSNPDGDFMAQVNQGLLTVGMVGTALGTNVYWSGGSAANPSAAWNEVYTNSGANVFDLYHDTVLKASATLTNHAAGTRYAFTNYYGTIAGLTSYKNGYPVWVDADNSGTYSAGDYALVNPNIKHDAVYCMAPTIPYPGVCSFNPYTAWTNIVMTNDAALNTIPYTTYQEYLGGDYIGRLSWNAGGQKVSENDSEFALNRNSYSNPNIQDTDGDLIPDGWELYTGLNDNSDDAAADSDGDGLNNQAEWANASHALGSCAATWPNKLLPTDPGMLTAPQPNDPHPRDTDWDGATDGDEQTPGSNPTSWDTDGDHLPDAWELYAGTSVTNSDALTDLDGDGLLNYQEYWCGAVPEWQLCNPAWQTIRFCVRRAMEWDPNQADATDTVFIPPDYISDPCFMLTNSVYTSLGYLRTNYPAASVLNYSVYHTPLANIADSDLDGMDDYWEVYHGLNPCRGSLCRTIDSRAESRSVILFGNVAEPDADHSTPGYQFGLEGDPFTNLLEYIQYVEPYRDDPDTRIIPMLSIVGPFNFGLNGMDPDGDGLPNLEEYSYNMNRAFYHTDPSPIWRTDQNGTNSFVWNNYSSENVAWWKTWDLFAVFPFKFDLVEGYDTDNDGVSDYAEINSAAGQTGNNPLDDRNPIRNRALYFNGTNDFTRQVRSRAALSESDLIRFCVEAWIKPDNPTLARNQVVMEKAGLYNNPLNPGNWLVGANFRMGLTNGLPYVLYNGRGSLRAYQAMAQMKHRITSNTNWTYIAGSYDGTNLIIYVNGEESYSLRSTELPANGFDVLLSSNTYLGTAHTLMVGARDDNAGRSMFLSDPSPTNYFGGCIDEVRVWNGAHTRAEILANKDRRLTQNDITNAMTSIFNYFTFDDVPDPNRSGEAIFPAGMADISFDMHPTIAWWRDYAMRSTVYTGVTNSYNYMVYASDNAWHSRATSPAADDYYHFSTNGTTNAVSVSGYVNPGNPYYFNLYNNNYIYDLLLFRGARGVATNSWLSGLTGDPDSTDTDGDGLPDWWEQLYNLDPNDATGDNGAWGDVDNDGLNNRAEYLAGTSPRNSDTDGDGIGDYDSRSSPYTRTWGEMYMDGDGMPDIWEMQYGLDPYHYDAQLDLDNDGWSNFAEYQGGTNPNDASSYPQPSLSGSADYFGNNSGSYQFFVYNTNTMDGVPTFTAASTATNNVSAFSLTGFKEGDFYLMALMDINGNGAFDAGEPMGIMEDQPLTMGYTNSQNIKVHIKDTAPGYGRFAWTGNTTGTSDYPAVINKISESGAPPVLTRTVRWSRNFIHEWDYQLAGLYGLGSGQYQWWMNGQQGTFSVTWPSSMSTPTLVYPRGDVLNYARNKFKWTMDVNSTMYHLQVARQAADRSLAYVLDNYYPTPYSDQDGVSQAYLPKYAGELGDGVYYWRVASWSPAGESAWSEAQTFEINLSATNSHWLAGDIYYFGKADCENIVVEAFNNRGFSGNPDARVLLTGAVRSNSFKGAFNLRGLDAGTYYVRAYLDVTPAGGTRDGKRNSPWESWGFIRDPNNDYQPRTIPLINTMFVDGMKLIIRDQDTDNDLLPDAWEMYYFGNLDQTGDMDYDGDGETNLEEYMRDGVDMNPAFWDTDGDGLSDAFELNYTAPSFGYSAKSGQQLNPNLWDTDGDGYSDGAEMKRYHTDPLDPTSYPRYQPMCFDSSRSPGDYDGDGRSDLSVYDIANGNWYVMTAAGQFGNLSFGSSATQPMLGDYDGDGCDDFAVFEPATGAWHLYNAWTGQSFRLNFGDSEMMPVPADYDGDNKTDMAVYYPADGMWYIYSAWSGQFYSLHFGGPTCVPVPGDYNADGAGDLATYEPNTGNWNIFVFDHYRHEGTYFSGNFGGPTMVPAGGDYDGDGRNDAALFDASTGYWHILTWRGQFLSGQFGGYGCIPAPGDYDGDGRTDICVYYPPTGTWYIYCWSGQAYQVQFGFASALPALKGR